MEKMADWAGGRSDSRCRLGTEIGRVAAEVTAKN